MNYRIRFSASLGRGWIEGRSGVGGEVVCVCLVGECGSGLVVCGV